MADSEQAEVTVSAASPKKDRSPSFPFITLTKAVERTRELYVAGRRHEMRLADAAAAMSYGAKSSGAIQTLAALIAYGLVEDSGAKENRKFRVSDLGFTVLEDQRPGARERALSEAALSPKMIAEYAVTWATGRPADGVAISHLRFEDQFTQDGAKSFLRVFDDAMTYAKVAESDKTPDTSDDFDALLEPSNQSVNVGDWVRVESGGQIVFEKTRVRAIDGPWIFVEASQSGAKMTDITLLEKASPPADPPPVLPFASAISHEAKPDEGEDLDRFTVDEGVVKVIFPSSMSADSVEELEAFFALFIKKAKRRASAERS
jgi:hypothetical protein